MKKKNIFLRFFLKTGLQEKNSIVSSYNFIIDNEKPEKPEILGIENNSVSSDRVIISPSNEGRC